MRRCLKVGMLAVLCWCVCCAAVAADKNDVVEPFEKGHINWSTGILASRGVGIPPKKNEAKNSEKLQQSLNQARSDALKNMLEIVLQTRVNSLEHVRSIASESDMIMAKVESLVKSAKVVKQTYLSDGTVNVTMQMNMQGGFAQFVLPEEIKQIEPIKTVAREDKSPAKTPGGAGEKKDAAAQVFTGLVVDARGIQFTPAMVPVIMDEKGREVFGSAFASREFAVQQGMSGYARNIQAAGQNQRVAGNPLTVKGLRTVDKMSAAIIISTADATKIKSASEHLSFLKKCSVMIVVD